MTTNVEEEVNYTSLVELFGTFFEKVTNLHPERDTLNKQLSEFKRVLYTNKSNFPTIDTYLEDLRQKSQIARVAAHSSTQEGDCDDLQGSPHSDSNSGEGRLKSFSPEAARRNTKCQKFSLLTIADFLKYRLLEQPTHKYTLMSKYAHVREVEPDSCNFYKLLAISSMALLLSSPEAEKRLFEIIDDVQSQKITLQNSQYSYTHEEYVRVFCGYLTQLLKLKEVNESSSSTLDLFYDMLRFDELFSLALICYLKEKVMLFTSQQLPSDFASNPAIYDQLQNSDTREKILNNNPALFEPLLHVLPFLLNLKIVTQVMESGALYERTYSKTAVSTSGGHIMQPDSERPQPAIHLLMEKIGSSKNFYILVQKELKSPMTKPSPINSVVASRNVTAHTTPIQPFTDDSPPRLSGNTAQATNVNGISDFLQHRAASDASASSHGRHSLSPNDVRGSPSLLPATSTAANVTTSNSTKPRIDNSIRSPRYFMTPSRQPPFTSNDDGKNSYAANSEKKKLVTEFGEIVHGSYQHRGDVDNEKENSFSPAKRSLQYREPELKDHNSSVEVTDVRSSLRNSISRSISQYKDSSSNALTFESRQDSQSHPTRSSLTGKYEAASAGLYTQGRKDEESPYDAYIKSRVTAASTNPSFQERAQNLSSTTKPLTQGITANPNPFSSTPYDYYATSYVKDTSKPATSLSRNFSGIGGSEFRSQFEKPYQTATSKTSGLTERLPTSGTAGGYSYSTRAEPGSAEGLFKNIPTLAPKNTDYTPSNPFNQSSNYRTSIDVPDRASGLQYGISYKTDLQGIPSKPESPNKRSSVTNLNRMSQTSQQFSHTSSSRAREYASVSNNASFTTANNSVHSLALNEK